MRPKVNTVGLVATKLCMQSGGCSEKPAKGPVKAKKVAREK